MKIPREQINETERTFPRTLEEAFGPYAELRVHELQDDKIVLWSCAGSAIALYMIIKIFG